MRLMESRVAVLETMYIGSSTSADSDPLPMRYQKIAGQLDRIETDIPDLAECRQLVKSIAPILSMKRSSLPLIAERAKELMQNKQDIEVAISQLQAIKTLESAVRVMDFQGKSVPSSLYLSRPDLCVIQTDLDALRARLESVDSQLTALLPQVAAQSKEIDTVLEVYEQSVRLCLFVLLLFS